MNKPRSNYTSLIAAPELNGPDASYLPVIAPATIPLVVLAEGKIENALLVFVPLSLPLSLLPPTPPPPPSAPGPIVSPVKQPEKKIAFRLNVSFFNP